MKNETFYVVAATVIPVYFLGLTLQSSLYKKIQAYFEGYFYQQSWKYWKQTLGSTKITDLRFVKSYLRGRPLALLMTLALTLTALAIILSAAAETLAILALSNGYAYQHAHTTILLALIVLTIGTALLILTRLYAPSIKLFVKLMFLAAHEIRKNISKKAAAPESTPPAQEDQ